MEENELFAMDHQRTVVDDSSAGEPPMLRSVKRPKIDVTSNYNDRQYNDASTVSKATDVTDAKPPPLSTTTTTTLCEFEIFGNYVAAVMKNMRKNDARQLQMKIVQLINSYDDDEDEDVCG